MRANRRRQAAAHGPPPATTDPRSGAPAEHSGPPAKATQGVGAGKGLAPGPTTQCSVKRGAPVSSRRTTSGAVPTGAHDRGAPSQVGGCQLLRAAPGNELRPAPVPAEPAGRGQSHAFPLNAQFRAEHPARGRRATRRPNPDSEAAGAGRPSASKEDLGDRARSASGTRPSENAQRHDPPPRPPAAVPRARPRRARSPNAGPGGRVGEAPVSSPRRARARARARGSPNGGSAPGAGDRRRAESRRAQTSPGHAVLSGPPGKRFLPFVQLGRPAALGRVYRPDPRRHREGSLDGPFRSRTRLLDARGGRGGGDR